MQEKGEINVLCISKEHQRASCLTKKEHSATIQHLCFKQELPLTKLLPPLCFMCIKK